MRSILGHYSASPTRFQIPMRGNEDYEQAEAALFKEVSNPHEE